METYISQIAEQVGKSVTLKGWVYNFRSSGGLYFLQIRDGSGFIQAVVEKKSVAESVWADCEKMTLETSVEVTGKVSAHPKQVGVFELQVEDIKVIQVAAEDYPISKKEHGPEFLLDNRHLCLRSPKQWAIMRVRDGVEWAIRKFMKDNGFVLVDAPILTKSACEGTTTLFKVDYYGGDAYLSQSGQLYTEACEYSLGRTYCFGPTFRAEKSKTRKHLTEFWMVEPEMPFMKFDELLDFEEEFLWYILQYVLKNCRVELDILERDVSFLENIKRPFDRLTYHEAIKILQESGESEIKDGDDLGAADETILTTKFKGPVLVHRFPTSLTNFFMEHDPKNSKVTLNVDMLAPEGYGEVIGGGAQRIGDPELLKSRMAAEGLKADDYGWYLDLLKYGGVPHCGFGLGLERCVAWLCGIKHIRETIPFPRMMNRLKP